MTGRHQGERAFREAALDAVVMIDAAGRILELNPAAERLFGYSEEEAVGRDMAELIVPPSFREAHRRGLARHLETGTSRILGRRVEMPAMRRDGRLFPAELSVVRAEGAGGPVFLASLRDVTERKRAEEERALLTAIIESSDDAIIAMTNEGVVVRWNQGAERMYGYRSEEILGRGVDVLEAEDRRGEMGAALARIRGSGESERLETRRLRKDGTAIEVSVAVSPLRDADGAIRGFTSVARDMTVRRRAEESLRESRTFLELAQAVAHIGSWVSDLGENQSLDWSEETCRIFGIPPERFDGRLQTFFSFVHPDDRQSIGTAVQRALALDEAYAIEHRIVRPDGSVRWVHERASAVRDADGNPVRLIGTIQDVTERRQLQEQLVQAQKLEAVGRLAGGIAHDFNNLLTAILGYASEILDDFSEDDVHRADLEEIRRAAERAAGLTRQLLAFSRKQALNPEVLDLNGAIGSVEKMLRRVIGEDVALETDLEPEQVLVRVDPGQVEQVLMNLALNARDAMPAGGVLRIGTGSVRLDAPVVFGDASLPAGSYVVLTVADTGSGMDAETRAHVFEPFFTTKERDKGTGLGLSTVHGIVRQSGGAIEVDSAPKRGSTFKIFFPRHDVRPPSAAEPPPAPKEPRGTETVLLVEDEAAIRNLLKKILEAAGYQVLVADRAESALQIFDGENGRINLLLTDVVMPGMNGPDLAVKLSTLRPGLRVLLMSGYSERAAEAAAEGARRWRLLEKPFRPELVVRAVRETLDGAPAPEPG